MLLTSRSLFANVQCKLSLDFFHFLVLNLVIVCYPAF